MAGCDGCYSKIIRPGCLIHKDFCLCSSCLIKMVCIDACEDLKRSRWDELLIWKPGETAQQYNWKKNPLI